MTAYGPGCLIGLGHKGHPIARAISLGILSLVLAATSLAPACGGSATTDAPTQTAAAPTATRPPVPTPPAVLVHYPTQGVGWTHQPAITVLARRDDDRIALVHEAVAFWDGQLERLGSPFRLGTVTVVTGEAPAGTIRILSDGVFGESWVTPAERDAAYERIVSAAGGPKDILVVLSQESTFLSFAYAGSLQPLQGVVGIRLYKGTVNTPNGLVSLEIPNAPRNVIAHELGHVLGLGHNNDPTKLMCGRPAECRPDVYWSETPRYFPLTDEEKARLRMLYPPR